jgi:hypothetical protein
VSEFLDRLKADTAASDHRGTLAAIAALPPRPPARTPSPQQVDPGQSQAPDDEAPEIQQLRDIKRLVQEVDAERPDLRLKRAAALCDQLITEESDAE